MNKIKNKKVKEDEEENLKDNKKVKEDEEENLKDNKKVKEDEEENLKDNKKVKEDEEENLKDNKKVKEDEEENLMLKKELEKTKSELQKCATESVNNFNKLKYLMADFDNYRKQSDKQIQTSITNNKAEIISKFLNIKDDYLRAIDIAKKSAQIDETIINGLDSILKNFNNILSSEGVEQIETIGKIFDPNKHDVVSFSHDSNLLENIITGEVRIGYTLNGKVLRPSMVIINKNI